MAMVEPAGGGQRAPAGEVVAAQWQGTLPVPLQTVHSRSFPSQSHVHIQCLLRKLVITKMLWKVRHQNSSSNKAVRAVSAVLYLS